MTVYNELNKIAYIGSSEQTLYPIPFEYISTDDIKVSVYTSNNEFVEDWTYSTQYVIEGGNVKVLSGYNIDNTKKLLILRSVDLIQDNKYREGGDFPAKSTETSFDKLTMITQQLQETLDRCVKVEVLDIQTPEELLQTVYDKLDSATEIAGDAISAANQAQTAADNATAAVNSAEQTLVQTQAYVDSAKVEIDNTKNTAINTIKSVKDSATSEINSAVSSAETEITGTKNTAINTINTAVSNAESNISTIVSDAEGSITSIAVTEANKAIANAAQEATDIAVAKLQPYVNQAQEDANSAASSMEQAALSATAASNYASNASADAVNAAESAGQAANSAIWAEGTDAQVQALGGEKSAKGWAEASTNLNHTNITNCITKIPQDIKLELNNGTLTLKNGSKAYKFDNTVVNITKDLSISNVGSNGQKLLFTNGNSLAVFLVSTCASGATDPGAGYQVWYNSSEKKIYVDGAAQGNFSLSNFAAPIGIVTCQGGKAVSIDQVFNGFGYIGSTVFALPGVEGLIPNGRNTDGSLNSIKFTTTKVLTSTRNNAYDQEIILNQNEIANSLLTYDFDNNIMLSYAGSVVAYAVAGKVSADSTGHITSFNPKQPIKLADEQDVALLNGNNNFTGFNNYTRQITVDVNPISFVAQNSLIEAGVTPATNLYCGYDFRAKNGARLAWLGVEYGANGVKRLRIQKQHDSLTEFNLSAWKVTVGTPVINATGAEAINASWFNTKIQVVSTLPASPDPNVYYFIPE